MEPKCLSRDEWIRRCGIYIQWTVSHQRELNNAICSNMYGHRDYHTKCSKSDRERKIYDIYMISTYNVES